MKVFQKEMLNLKNNIYWFTWIKWIFSLFVFSIILIKNHSFFKDINIGTSINIIRLIPKSNLLLYFIYGIFSILIISLYDIFWFYFNPKNIKKIIILKVSFIANSVNNLASLGGLSGSIIRIIFYRNTQLKELDLMKLNILLFPSFFTGLGILMLINVFNLKNINYYFNISFLVYLTMIFFILYLLIFFFSEFIPIKDLKLKFKESGFVGSIKLKISMVLISTFDWLSSSLFIWIIALHFNKNLNFLNSTFFFSIAYAIGLSTFLPASILVFDIIMLLGLVNLQLTATEALSVIILYRFFYYIIPFLIGTSLTTYELIKNGNGFIKIKNIKALIIELEKMIKLSRNQQNFLKDILAFLFETLIFLGSIIIIITAIAPALGERVLLVKTFVSLDLLSISQKTSFITGVLLLIFIYEIKLKVKRAYFTTIFLLIFGIIFTLLRGFNIEESLILIIITYIFRYTKTHFYRVSVPINLFRIIKEMVLAQLFITIYIFSGQISKFSFYPNHKGIELLYMTPKNYIHTGIFFTIFIQGFIILWNLFWNLISKQTVPWYNQTEEFVYDRLDFFLSEYKGTMLSHLIYSGDKYIYISKDKNMFIAFRPFEDKIIVLGDPIGNSKNLINNLDEFRTYIDVYGYIPIYYQISEDFMGEYHEIGYNFFKLGEDSTINLNTYSHNLTKKNKKKFNHVIENLEDKNWDFKISYPPHSDIIMNEFKKISDEWLKKRKEKGFSLAFFDKNYLRKNPIAYMCSPSQKIVAFVSIVTIYKKELFSVDLIRVCSESPKNAMDYLLLNLFCWGLEKGYKSFYMGMAPLFNVGISKHAEKEEKIAKLIFKNIRFTYNFKGLYEYKEKFNPVWKPKYIAYPKELRIEFILLIIAIMISQSSKKILK